MARKPTLSPSKITTYLACPTKYYWTYLDERGRFYLRSKSYFSFGTSLHRVLQRFHDANDQGVTTTSEAVAAVDESWIDAGYASSQEMMEARSEGKAIVEAYVEQEILKPSAGRTILVEKRLRKDLGEFDLIGIVDRVDELPDGSLEIIDYKSGRQSVTPEEIADDMAMGIYQLLLRALYPGVSVRATIIALRSGDRASAEMTDDQAAEFEFMVKELGLTILNRSFEGHIPVAKPLCERCDFLPLCKKHESFGAL